MHLTTLCFVGIVVALSAAAEARSPFPFGSAECAGKPMGFVWDVKPGCQQCRCENGRAYCYTCQNMYEKGGDLSLPFPQCCPSYMMMRNPWQALFDRGY